MIVELLAAVAVTVLTLGFTYFCVLVAMGTREARRAERELREELPPAPEMPIFFLVPCLDEELVIADTVRNLLAGAPHGHVVVVDDASDDATAARALEAGGERVTVVRRLLPDARLGKGPALNAGYAELRRLVAARGLDPAEVVVCVMDADGRLSEGAVGEVARLFEDPGVGGAQLGVRIRNRGTLLTNMQDFEFWGLSAVAQFARRRTASVSLGGNGQFTRLSALQSVGDAPWSRALTEDLDLAISLQLRGWKLTSTPRAWVSQQGVESLRALLRQRTRWYQGHMVCSARVGELWRCMRLSNLTVLETVTYLLSPLLLALPWSIIFNLALIDTWRTHAADPPFLLMGSELLARLLRTGAWYLVSFLPAIVMGFVYARRERGVSTLRAIGYGHLMVLYTYLTWFSCWAALLRIALRRDSWTKTTRSAEVEVTGGAHVLGI